MEGKVIRYEHEGNELWAILELQDGDRIRVLVSDGDGDVQW